MLAFVDLGMAHRVTESIFSEYVGKMFHLEMTRFGYHQLETIFEDIQNAFLTTGRADRACGQYTAKI